MNIAIIPARQGSKRIKNKNIKLFFKKPIIYHTIRILKESKIFDHIIITSDSNKILNYCKKQGCDILIKSGNLKKPIQAAVNLYERMPDEYPILFCLAGLTKGVSVFKGIEDLANKESNRIKEMQKILRQIGIKSEASKNQLKIFGKAHVKNMKKVINIENLGDHRICMSAAIISLATGIKTKIKNLLFTGQSLNMHGILGVTIGAVVTCSEILGKDYLLNKVLRANGEEEIILNNMR